MYDLSTGELSEIIRHPFYQLYPAIYADKVVWENTRNGSYDIYMYDLSTAQEIPIATDPELRELYPAIHGDIITWSRYHRPLVDIEIPASPDSAEFQPITLFTGLFPVLT